MNQLAQASLAVALLELSPEERALVLEGLSEEDLQALCYDWPFWARPNQLAPPGEWFCWLILAGRGFGKTRSGAEWTIERAKSNRFRYIGLIGETAADVRDIMVEGESGILACSPPWFYPKYEPSKRKLTWPNGAEAHCYSGEEPDMLRGPQHDTVWADEPAKWRYADDAWEMMEFGLRLGPQPQVCATTTPKPTKLIRDLVKDPSVVVSSGSTYENIGNLAPNFIQRVVYKFEGTRLGQQELHARLLDDVPGALWKRSLLDATRVRTAPPLIRVVGGLDPSVTAGEESDEAGIIFAGLAENGHAYVLADRSLLGSPHEWASSAATGFWELAADTVYAEANNGGDMVIHTIHTVDKHVNARKVWASRGKYTRAEPVSAIYEQGRAHHVGYFPDLEDEMCNWVPGEKSPNRMDALVWALWGLLIEGGEDYVVYTSAGSARSGMSPLGGRA